MEPTPASLAADLLNQQVSFLYAFFQATELEARAMERYLLLALGGMYSYLATKEVPQQYRGLAWYAPTGIAAFAALRAVVLAVRQAQIWRYIGEEVERQISLPSGVQGWAHWYNGQTPYVLITAAAFYVLVIVSTFVIARRMTRTP